MKFLISQIKHFIWCRNFVNSNKKLFPIVDNKEEIKSSQILVEFNAFQNSHVPISYLSNVLSKKYKSKINAFYNYSLISSPLRNSIFNEIKWIIGNFFSLKNFGIYRSFGVKDIFKPQVKNNIKTKIDRPLKLIFDKIKNKEDVLKIKFDNILVGDLIYDTYLKKFVKPTIDLKDDDFLKLVNDFFLLYLFWKNYFNKNNVKAVIGVHTPYSYGLVLRLAIYRKIPVYVTSSRFIYFLNKKMPYMHGHFKNFRKKFLMLDKNLRTRGLILAKERLKLRFKGMGGAKVDLISNEKTSFGSKTYKNLIFKSKRKKILIAPHDFFDAVHLYGNTLFVDFYEWLNFLGKISNETDYDWYIKNRPNFKGKFQRYQPHTNDVIQEIIKKYPRIKLLPNEYSHKQIIKEKIDFVLTCYGSVGVEYPYFNIPVINASINNPHINYNFNFNPKSKKSYKVILKNLNKIKNRKYSKKEIYEYYFMRNIFTDKNWLISDLSKMVKFVGGYDGMWSSKFYEYWIRKLNKKKHHNIIKSIENLITSRESFININHTKNIHKL